MKKISGSQTYFGEKGKGIGSCIGKGTFFIGVRGGGGGGVGRGILEIFAIKVWPSHFLEWINA